MTRRAFNRVDANQGEVIRVFQELGAVVIDMTGDSTIGFDLLVAWQGFLIPVEVKDGGKIASKRKLTKKEMERREQFAGVGVTVQIVDSPADVRRLLGVSTETLKG